jgi:hypothetical protein
LCCGIESSSQAAVAVLVAGAGANLLPLYAWSKRKPRLNSIWSLWIVLVAESRNELGKNLGDCKNTYTNTHGDFVGSSSEDNWRNSEEEEEEEEEEETTARRSREVIDPRSLDRPTT